MISSPRMKNKFEVKIEKDKKPINPDVLASVTNVIVNGKSAIMELVAYEGVNTLNELIVNELYKVTISDYVDDYKYLDRFCFLDDISYDLSKSEDTVVSFVLRFTFVDG